MKPYLPDESNAPLIAWVGLIILVNIYWIGYDVWARLSNKEYMTTEFKEGLHNTLYGPLIMGLVAFTVIAFLTHMLNIGSQAQGTAKPHGRGIRGALPAFGLVKITVLVVVNTLCRRGE